MQVTPFNYDYDVSHVLARHSILGLCSLEMCTTDVHVGNIMWQAMSQLPPREPRDSERLHRRDSSHGSYHQRAIKLTFNSYSSTTISIVCLGGEGGGVHLIAADQRIANVCVVKWSQERSRCNPVFWVRCDDLLYIIKACKNKLTFEFPVGFVCCWNKVI